MLHYWTIGYFDPKRIYPWRNLRISKTLEDEDIQKLQDQCPLELKFRKSLNSFLQPTGTLVLLWTPNRLQKQIEILAEVADQKFGMSVADVGHAQVVYPVEYRIRSIGTFNYLIQCLQTESKEDRIHVLDCLSDLIAEKKDRYEVWLNAIKELDLLPTEQQVVSEVKMRFEGGLLGNNP